MTKAEGAHHPFWMFTALEENKTLPFDEEHTIETYYQSNLLPPVYRLNGVVDVISVPVLRSDHPNMYGDDMRMLEIPERVSLDIDTEFELKMAEFMFGLHS